MNNLQIRLLIAIMNFYIKMNSVIPYSVALMVYRVIYATSKKDGAFLHPNAKKYRKMLHRIHFTSNSELSAVKEHGKIIFVCKYNSPTKFEFEINSKELRKANKGAFTIQYDSYYNTNDTPLFQILPLCIKIYLMEYLMLIDKNYEKKVEETYKKLFYSYP